MGHYDDCYEYDEEKCKKESKDKTVTKECEEGSNIVIDFVKVLERFNKIKEAEIRKKCIARLLERAAKLDW